MVTYIKTTCQCCGEEIEWASAQYAPRCDECRRTCMKHNNYGEAYPCKK